MPTMANVTVKKSDGTTDIQYSVQSASAGDGNYAIWSALAVGNTLKAHPDARVTTTGNANVRRITWKLVYPILQTDTGSGITSVIGTCERHVTDIVPNLCDDATVAEFAAQAGNFLAATLPKSVVTQRYSPT